MILHTVKTSPLTDHALSQALDYMTDNAGLLLMQDAVVAATNGHPWRDKLIASSNMQLYVLADDLSARGLTQRVQAPFIVIDYPRFVSLCLEFDAVKSW